MFDDIAPSGKAAEPRSLGERDKEAPGSGRQHWSDGILPPHGTLGQTFRFARGILEPSTAFVVRNPAQTQRALRPAPGVPDGGVTVVAAEGDARGLEQALRDIEKREGKEDPPLSVLVLGRYRDSGAAVSSRRRGRLRLEFSTVHAAKGHQADYAVVLDLRNARRGFPSQLEDPLLDLVLPPPLGGRYAHDEERRLLYVAMTRGRRGAYLVADALRPSAFVEECCASPPTRTGSASSGVREHPRARAAGQAASPRRETAA